MAQQLTNETSMTPGKMLADLFRMFPHFKRQWKSDDNYCVENDGSFTYHGLFIEFQRYFVDNLKTFSPQKIKEFCEYIEQFVRDDHEDDIDNAICTCFLESAGTNPKFINSERSAKYDKKDLTKEFEVYNILIQYLGAKSLNFYLNWNKM